MQESFKVQMFKLSQVYAVTGTGFTDTKNSHYTQFSGALLRQVLQCDKENKLFYKRPSRLAPDTIKAARQGLREDEELSIAEGEEIHRQRSALIGVKRIKMINFNAQDR